MSRKIDREIARLNKLADYIEANPKEYNQKSTSQCVVGLGAKFSKNEGFSNVSKFSKYFGISEDATFEINWGKFKHFSTKFRDNKNSPRTSYKTAVKLLRHIAEQKNNGVVY